MLDVATVLSTMFTQIDDFCKLAPLKRVSGPSPKVSDSELITIYLFCELAGKHSESEHVRFVKQWLYSYFPRMIDQSRYHRRLANLGRLINDVRLYVLNEVNLGLSDDHIIDSTPIPVIGFRRAHYTPLFPEAAYGRCAARNLTYYGFKLHLITDTQGIPVHFEMTPANVADGSMTEETLMLSSQGRTVFGDKGYLSASVKKGLMETASIDLRTPVRNNMKNKPPKADTRVLNSLRQRIETTNGMLKDHFSLEKVYSKTLFGLALRVLGKITAFVFGVLLNRLFGRSPLAIASLVN